MTGVVVIEGELAVPAGPVRCYATSKRTGVQCGRLVRAKGHLCKWHGGKNPVVAARQEMEAAFSRGYRPVAPTDPLSSIEDMLGLSQQIVAQLRVVADQAAGASTEQMVLLGSWMDRLMRFAQTMQNLTGLKVQLDEAQADLLVVFIDKLLVALGHDAQDPAVCAIVREQLQAMEDRGELASRVAS